MLLTIYLEIYCHSAYPSLVKTLKTIFCLRNETDEHVAVANKDKKQIDLEIGNIFDQARCGGNVTPDSNINICSKLDGVEFLMSWQRRISDSEIFFQMMKDEGFHVYHHGKCIYSFFLFH